MTLQQAYDAWVRLAPYKTWVKAEYVTLWRNGSPKRCYIPGHYEGNCCSNMHTMIVYDDFSVRIVNKPDSQVCARELAWRIYVHIRDNLN